MGFSREAKVGLFTVVVAAIGFWATFYIGKLDVSLRGGATHQAVLKSAHQLGVDSQVEVAGVPVGRITKVDIVRGGRAALITFRMTDPDIEIYRDARISVITSGFLGDRYVELFPGTEDAGPLPEEEPIVDTTVPIALEEMMAHMTPLIENAVALIEDMRTLLDREEIREGIPETIDSLRHTALSLELVLADYEKYISKFIRNAAETANYLSVKVPKLLDDIGDKFDTSGGAFESLASTVTDSVGSFKKLSRTFEQTANHLEQILADINKGEGTVGALLKDEETAGEIKEVVSSLNQTLSKVNRLRTTVNYLGSYESDFSDGDGWRHRAEIHVQPSYDHYYAVGIIDRSEDVTSRRTLTVDQTDAAGTTTSYTRTIREEKSDLLFNAQIAKRFYDLTLRGGIIESEGGVGMDYAMFDDRLWLSSEAFDFARNGDRPRVRTWAELRLFKHLRIAVGAEDLAGRAGPRAMFGAGITFSDEDLKFLFGALPSVNF